MQHYHVVDLGAKKGAAVDVYRKQRQGSLFADVDPGGDRVLAVEWKSEYGPQLREKGFDVLIEDVVDLFRRPELPFAADIFLASNFLEHLADVPQAQWVLKRMLEEARIGVWLWMPSFEQDETGEGQLRRHGLQFSWTCWKGHSAHLLLKHVREVIGRVERPHQLKIYPSIYLRDSAYRMVVPLRDWKPDEVVEYDRNKHGPKPRVRFNPPVVREWGVQLRFRKGS